jgi:hypothetical protein
VVEHNKKSSGMPNCFFFLEHAEERIIILALFCWSYFGLFQLVSAYSLSQNTIESAETSRLFHQPNQPIIEEDAQP